MAQGVAAGSMASAPVQALDEEGNAEIEPYAAKEGLLHLQARKATRATPTWPSVKTRGGSFRSRFALSPENRMQSIRSEFCCGRWRRTTTRFRLGCECRARRRCTWP